MSAWTILNEKEYNHVWNKFEIFFNFSPSVNKENWPVFLEPAPFITYDISQYYDKGLQSKIIIDFYNKMRKSFQGSTRKGDKLYALDWQHRSYIFDPFSSFDYKNEENWLVPIIPDGDYYIFLAEDFSFGVLGQPWEHTICVFGEKLISVITKNKPTLLVGKQVRERRQ